MTVERLIELLQKACPQALVFVELYPCTAGGPPNLDQVALEGVPVCVHQRGHYARVYIEAEGHDC